VRRGEILSRERVSNKTILEAITRWPPRTLLDLGCGEGWLAHHCALNGIEVLGIETSATHMEWFYGPKGLKFSEIGCRPPGVRTWDLYNVGNDMDLYRKITKEHSDITPIVDEYHAYKKNEDNLNEAQSMLSDPEMKEFAQEEIEQHENEWK
jgi:SAM-dependent methyltransferase